jgi:hypothetical protein
VVVAALVVVATGTDNLLWRRLGLAMVRRREEGIALRRRANTIIMPVHESRVHMRGRRLLVLQAVVALYPLAIWVMGLLPEATFATSPM